MSTGTAAEGTERPQFAEIDAKGILAGVWYTDEPVRWNGTRWVSLIGNGAWDEAFVTAVRPLRLVPVEAGTVGGTERDVIEAAVEAAAKVIYYGAPEQIGYVLWGSPRDMGPIKTARDALRAAYPVIAVAVRAQVAEEIAVAIEATTILPVEYDVDRVANTATRIDAEIARRAAAAPVAAPTEPAGRAPGIDELVGIDPEWTGGLSTSDYQAKQRSTRPAAPTGEAQR